MVKFWKLNSLRTKWNATNQHGRRIWSARPRPGVIRRAHSSWMRRLIEFLELLPCRYILSPTHARDRLRIAVGSHAGRIMNDQQLAFSLRCLPACLLTRLISGLINYLQPSDAERRFCLLIKSAQESVAFPRSKLELPAYVCESVHDLHRLWRSLTGCNVDGLLWWGLRN